MRSSSTNVRSGTDLLDRLSGHVPDDLGERTEHLGEPVAARRTAQTWTRAYARIAHIAAGGGGKWNQFWLTAAWHPDPGRRSSCGASPRQCRRAPTDHDPRS